MKTLEANPLADNGKSAVPLAPAELGARLGRSEPLILLDVREYPEYAAGRIAGSRLIPLGELERRAGELEPDLPVVCVCQSGKRATAAAAKLAKLGRRKVTCLAGGFTAWAAAGLPVERNARAPWALERQVRCAAGLLVLIGLGLSRLWPAAIGLAWLIGAGLVFAALTDWCGMGLLLAKAPWNRAAKPRPAACSVPASLP